MKRLSPNEEQLIVINTDFIQLDQFLKWSNQVQTGGEAKHMVTGGLVTVNGDRELRRSRRLLPGDVVQAGQGPRLRVVSSSGKGSPPCG